MLLRLVLWPAGFALGVLSLALARDDPGFSSAGGSLGGALAFLAAGWALLACGLGFWARRPRNAVGPVLAAAGCAWFVAEWDNPGVGSAVVVHDRSRAVRVLPSARRLGDARVSERPTGVGWSERVVVATARGCAVLVLGLCPALVFDPAAQGCAQCPDNLLLVSDDAELYDGLNRLGVRLGLAWALLLIAVASWRLVRSTPARRRVVAPVVLAGSVYLVFVAGAFAASLDRGFLGSGTLEHRLWLGQAAALTALALAVGWGLVQARRTRSAVARLVVELGQPSAAGGLRDVLARALADPELELAYPVGEGRLARCGRAARAARHDGRPGGDAARSRRRPVAVLVHRPGLLDTPELVDEVASAARLALENERLHAQARAQLEDLRASRARIVEAGDAERRRLERDLHDGAQQRLVGLALGAAPAARAARTTATRARGAARRQADAELRRAVDELRELAHGIHPAVLGDEGLAAALEALAEGAPAPVRIVGACRASGSRRRSRRPRTASSPRRRKAGAGAA